ncbi:hypothetical protein [Neomicrococcus lactis]|uniref:hypothetical protein n=1 Tax=Neomicrococcus lactis TaxID=732241 RepID=UPI0023006A8E|nr:hypothetical protein [Neomicrococcus lactis]
MRSHQLEEETLDLSRGELLAGLYLNSREWVHRRVDSITLEQDGTTRRNISFDVEIPAGMKVSGSKNRCIVPLGLIEKGALQRVSTSDPAGHPMPVLTKSQNSLLAVELLLSVIPVSWYDDATGDNQIRAVLSQITSAPGPGGTEEEDEVVRSHAKQSLQEWFNSRPNREDPIISADYETTCQMILSFLDHFLLAVQIKDEFVGTRCVLKFVYERDLEIGRSRRFVADIVIHLPDAGFAQSQHVEFTTPLGLKVPVMAVLTDGEIIMDLSESDRRTAHVAFQAKGRTSQGSVLVEMNPISPGILHFTAFALTAVTLLTFLGLLEKLDLINLVGKTFRIPSQAVSLVLIGPALFLSWMSRAPEHEAIAVLLRPLRTTLLLCTCTLFLFATAAAVPLERFVWEIVWVLACIGTLSALTTFGIYIWEPVKNRVIMYWKGLASR